MKIKIEKTEDTEYNGLVWARMRFCPYWPARIVQTPPILGKTPPKKVCVLFFGEKQFGFVDRDKILDYGNNRDRFISKGRGLAFQNAVKQMDEYVSNPSKFRSHALVKPVQNKIRIKTERDIEQQLNIKTERRDSKRHTQNETPSSSNNTSDGNRCFIEKIVALKSENNQNLLALKSVQAECATMLKTKQKLELQIAKSEEAFAMQKKKMEMELDAIKQKFDAKKSNSDKIIADLKIALTKARDKLAENEVKNGRIIADLKNEIKSVQGLVKQYQRGLDQREEIMEHSYDEREFEVETIIGHKETANGKQYLIRWKGFGQDEDTWEKESNLNCPKILNAYIRLTVLKRK